MEGCNVVQLLEKTAHLLESFGGHAIAAGLALKPDQYAHFETAFLAAAEAQLADRIIEKVLNVEAELRPRRPRIPILWSCSPAWSLPAHRIPPHFSFLEGFELWTLESLARSI